MRRRGQILVRQKPKSWSIGLFIGACVWIIGETVWSLGDSLLWLGLVVLVTFLVDSLCTGSSSREGVYIE